MEIFVEQKLSAEQEMSIFGQFTESRIKVMVSDADGEGKEIGVVKHLYPKGNGFRLSLEFTERRHNKRTAGFSFTNFYGTWFVTRPD